MIQIENSKGDRCKILANYNKMAAVIQKKKENKETGGRIKFCEQNKIDKVTRK